MDVFTCEELQAIYLTGDGLLALCDMLSLVPFDDWPQDAEDFEWLLWSFDASKIS